jgi:hypothetical protein
MTNIVDLQVGEIAEPSMWLRFVNGRLQQRWTFHKIIENRPVSQRTEWRDVGDTPKESNERDRGQGP